MQQILFKIPIPFTDGEIPIFGFGMMMFVAFLVATGLAVYRAKQEGMDSDRIVDLGLWMFLGGIVGARIFFMAINKDYNILNFFQIWKGGIAFLTLRMVFAVS